MFIVGPPCQGYSRQREFVPTSGLLETMLSSQHSFRPVLWFRCFLARHDIQVH